MALKGVDVHDGSGVIDWAGLARGIQFAFVRAAYGRRLDKRLTENYGGAKGAGLIVGLYHFYRQPQPAAAQRQAMLRAIDRVRLSSGDLPPVIDVEDNPKFDGKWNNANNAAYIADLRDWLAAIREKVGQAPIVDTRASFWDQIGNPEGFENCPLWVASYGVTKPHMPQGWADYAFRQSSESAKLEGMPGTWDFNTFQGSLDDLHAMTLASTA
jgi:lysozyme